MERYGWQGSDPRCGTPENELDGCKIYISVRLAMESDHDLTIFEMDGQNFVADGLFGVHVDDIMACGEGVFGPEPWVS